MKRIILIFLLVFVTGCIATEFNGRAKVKGGRQQCEEICAEWGMVLAGMVALGEYTNGCICKDEDKLVSLDDAGETILLGAAAVAGSGAAATVIQSRNIKEDKRTMNGVLMNQRIERKLNKYGL